MQHLLLLQSVSGIIPAQLASSSSTSDLTVWLNLAASAMMSAVAMPVWLTRIQLSSSTNSAVQCSSIWVFQRG